MTTDGILSYGVYRLYCVKLCGKMGGMWKTMAQTTISQHERRVKNFEAGMEAEPKAVQEAIMAALHGACLLGTSCERGKMVRLINEIGEAKGRAAKRAESDKRTDGKRRKLVGAKIPIKEVERCKRCAEWQGISLYRFVVNALTHECEKVEHMYY